MENKLVYQRGKQTLSVKITTQLHQQLRTQIDKGKISKFAEKILLKN